MRRGKPGKTKLRQRIPGFARENIIPECFNHFSPCAFRKRRIPKSFFCPDICHQNTKGARILHEIVMTKKQELAMETEKFENPLNSERHAEKDYRLPCNFPGLAYPDCVGRSFTTAFGKPPIHHADSSRWIRD